MKAPRPADQLIGRQVWAVDDGEGRWRVYPALVLELRYIDARDHSCGPYQGAATLAWVLESGALRVREMLHVSERFRMTNHGWFYSLDDLNEAGREWMTQEGRWPAAMTWRERPSEEAEPEP